MQSVAIVFFVAFIALGKITIFKLFSSVEGDVLWIARDVVCVNCVLILEISGGTYSLTSTPKDRFFENSFLAIFIYSQSFYQKSAKRKSPKKYLQGYLKCWLRMAFGESTMTRRQVQVWYNRIKEGRVDVNDDAQPRRPSTSMYIHNWSLQPFR